MISRLGFMSLTPPQFIKLQFTFHLYVTFLIRRIRTHLRLFLLCYLAFIFTIIIIYGQSYKYPVAADLV